MPDTKSPTPFWLVWNPNGRQPNVRHATRESARQEALYLAKSCPGQEFYVLAPLSRAVVSGLEVEQYSEETPC